MVTNHKFILLFLFLFDTSGVVAFEQAKCTCFFILSEVPLVEGTVEIKVPPDILYQIWNCVIVNNTICQGV